MSMTCNPCLRNHGSSQVRDRTRNCQTYVLKAVKVTEGDNPTFRGVRGEKKAMLAHILGPRNTSGKECPHVAPERRRVARSIGGDSRKRERDNNSEDDTNDIATDSIGSSSSNLPAKRAKVVERQTTLTLPRGVDVPFSEDAQKLLKRQALRATISANLPFRWLDDPEVIKLIFMLRPPALAVLPGRNGLSGSVLTREAEMVEQKMEADLCGICCGLS